MYVDIGTAFLCSAPKVRLLENEVCEVQQNYKDDVINDNAMRISLILVYYVDLLEEDDYVHRTLGS